MKLIISLSLLTLASGCTSIPNVENRRPSPYVLEYQYRDTSFVRMSLTPGTGLDNPGIELIYGGRTVANFITTNHDSERLDARILGVWNWTVSDHVYVRVISDSTVHEYPIGDPHDYREPKKIAGTMYDF